MLHFLVHQANKTYQESQPTTVKYSIIQMYSYKVYSHSGINKMPPKKSPKPSAKQQKPQQTTREKMNRMSIVIPLLVVATSMMMWSVDQQSQSECWTLMAEAEGKSPNKTAVVVGWFEAAFAREQLCPWVGHVNLFGFGETGCLKQALGKAAFGIMTGTPGKRSSFPQITKGTEAARRAVDLGATEQELQLWSKKRIPGNAISSYDKMFRWSQFRQQFTTSADRLPYAVNSDGKQIRPTQIMDYIKKDKSYSSLQRFSLKAKTPEKGETKEQIKHIRNHGFTILKGVLSEELCDEVQAETEKHSNNEFYLRNKNRKHVRYDIVDGSTSVERALKEVTSNSIEFLSETVGVDADLAEFASFTTEPRAAAQDPHDDCGFLFAPPHSPMYTMFIALTDITPDMAPVEVWPDTHTLRSDHHHNREGIREGISKAVSIKGTISKGDAVVIDGTVFHRGTAHHGTKTRYVLYASYVARPGMVPFGSTYAMLEHLIGKHNVSSVIKLGE